MRSIPDKNTAITTPVREIGHVKDRVDIVNHRLVQTPCNHRIAPARMSLAKLLGDSIHVRFLATVG